MSQTLQNGIKVPTNPDVFASLTGDLATMGGSANVVIPVANQTARDALTGKFAGMAVSRLDVPGEPVEIWNGSSWDRTPSMIVQAASQHVGSGMAVNAFTTGTFRPIIQAGSQFVNTSSDGSGSFAYPVPFPNGVIAIFVVNGDHSAGGGEVFSVAGTPYTQSTTTLYMHSSVNAAVSRRVDWIAIGW